MRFARRPPASAATGASKLARLLDIVATLESAGADVETANDAIETMHIGVDANLRRLDDIAAALAARTYRSCS